MKTRTPLSQNDLKIGRHDRVLEIGPGHNPFYRANVILEKFIDTNYHRCGDVKVYPYQKFYHADGARLPFEDKEFDYIYCSNVLEHVDDPAAFLEELSRVGKRGYIETPSLTGEHMFPKQSHKWCSIDIDGKIVMFEKANLPGNYGNDYGEAMLNYLPFQSLPFRLMQYTETQFSFVRYEWEDHIDYEVNPDNEEYRALFMNKWDRKMTERMFPPRSKMHEFGRTLHALWLVMKETMGIGGAHRGHAIPLSEYVKDHEVFTFLENETK